MLEVAAGPVFADSDGELRLVRRALAWYPGDLRRYVLACGWARIALELPLIGRAADVGDGVGSRIIAARLVLCRKSHQLKDEGYFDVTTLPDGTIRLHDKWGGNRTVRPAPTAKTHLPTELPDDPPF